MGQGWLKEILDENRKTVEDWPGGKSHNNPPTRATEKKRPPYRSKLPSLKGKSLRQGGRSGLPLVPFAILTHTTSLPFFILT